MEVVRVFNNELSSLYEVKPPISKAKMTQITKSAIKGIKFYKHIVQSVEKFIQKCRPEYKVPGLYVVDSIVRQSRHQFGADKDVFGPRFVKNINLTFQHLFKCNPDDRSKIIRVLNLWQKNAVFPIDVIQPLLDMGHPNSSSESFTLNDEKEGSHHKVSTTDTQSWKGWPQANDEPEPENRNYVEMSTRNLEKFMKAEMSNVIEEEASHSSLVRNQTKPEKPIESEENTVKFNKKLLDFDYGDEDEEDEARNDDNLPSTPNALALSMAQNLLSNPDLLRQLQQMHQTIQLQQNDALSCDMGQHNKTEVNNSSFSSNVSNSPQQPPLPNYEAPHLPLPPTEADKDDRVMPQPPLPPQDLDERSLASILTPHRPLPPTTIAAFLPTSIPIANQIEGDKDDRIIPDASSIPARDQDERSLANILAPLERVVLPPMPFTEPSSILPMFPSQPQPLMDTISMEAAYPSSVPTDQVGGRVDEDERVLYGMNEDVPLASKDFDERTLMATDERVKRERSRSGSRSRGRSGRRRSRSKSPRRKRSRSRSRSRKSSRAEERERIREKERERERERERKKKGLPSIKKGCVSVCSTTLWLGHVPKSCTEADISTVFGEYGTILSIDMIPPRGCAYVVMDRRQDANKAILKLKNLKIQSSLVKMAWAPGKGVKGKEYKEYWEVNTGVSYVPYEKIPEDAESLELLEEGGFIDEDSLPENLKALRNQASNNKSALDSMNKLPVEPIVTTAFSSIHAPPMVPPPIIPPNSVNLPGMVLPHLMQPQFGIPMPGMLPPQAMVMQVPMGIPPPNPMLMVQQQSQNILNPMGLPQMIPRAVPPVANALQNFKNVEPAVNSPNPAGDATPTDEDGTSVSSPNVVHASNPPPSSSVPISTQQTNPITQFNPLLSLQNTARSMMSVPPPVSSAGTPIPYPPPNVGFNYPPPVVRPPGQMQSQQFPWMHQKSTNSSFTDSDQTTNQTSLRPSLQPGMPPQMFTNRPPFLGNIPSANQTPLKEGPEYNVLEKNSNDMEVSSSANKNVSPGHHDMVISTDDESSLDRDFVRNDINAGPRFQGPTEFPRLPLGMHHGRGPPSQMQGMRFRSPMASPPFPMRMPRGMNMHPVQRMDMHSRSPRMPRRDPVQENRDWYPRDYDNPPYEEENRYDRDDRHRDSWVAEKRDVGTKQLPMDSDDRNSVGEGRSSRSYSGENRFVEESQEKHNYASERKEPPKSSSSKNSKPSKSLLDDMFKLRFYQRDKDPSYASHLSKRLETKKKKESKDKPEVESRKDSQAHHTESPSLKKCEEISQLVTQTDQFSDTRKEKDRESRKRSRWGRTLSEEREFQQLKRTEIEMKFQSYEQSSRALQALLSSNETPCDKPSDNLNTCESDAAAESLAADSANVSADIMNISADIVNVSADIVNVSADTVNASADTMSASADTVSASADTVSVSADTVNVSADTVSVDADIVNVSADFENVSAHSNNLNTEQEETMQIETNESFHEETQQSVNEVILKENNNLDRVDVSNDNVAVSDSADISSPPNEVLKISAES